jgi:hypothetical protein
MLQNALQPFNQRRQIVVQDCPEYIKIHLIVAMDQTVSEADDILPRNHRMIFAKLPTDSGRCLAHYLQETDERQVELSVCIQKSKRVFPRAISAASTAWSSMCCNRRRSSCQPTEYLRLCKHFITNILAQEPRGVQVHLAAENFG